MLTPQVFSTIRAISTAPFIRPGKFRPGLKALLMLPLMFSSSRLLASAHDSMSAAGAPGVPNVTGPAAQSGYILNNSAQGLGQSIVNGAPGTLQNIQNAPVPHLATVPPTLPGAADAAGGMAFSWASYIQGMGMFFILLALLWLAVWLLKRYGAGRFKVLTGRGKSLELVETLSLGPKRTAVLLRAKDRTFLLGVTEHRISMLSEIYDDTGAEAHNFKPDQTQE